MKNLLLFVFAAVVCGCTQKAEVVGTPGASQSAQASEKVAEPAEECVRWGCSNQFCGDPKEIGGGMSTCEWREEYRCAQLMACGRDAEKKCALTPTDESEKCFAEVKSAPPEM